MSLKETGAWILGKMLCHPIETVVYGSIAAIVLGLTGHVVHESWTEANALRKEFEVSAAEYKSSRLSLPDSLLPSVNVHEWNPIDVTERINEGMERLEDKLLLEPHTSKQDPLRDSVSPNGRWWAARTAMGESGDSYLAKHLIESRGILGYSVDTRLLFDGKNKRVYALTWGDEERVGFPSNDFGFRSATASPGLPQVADNGVCAYTINSRDTPAHESGRRPSQARVIADISNKRKYVIPIRGYKIQFYPSVELARDGSTARIECWHYDKRYAELNIKNGTMAEKRE